MGNRQSRRSKWTSEAISNEIAHDEYISRHHQIYLNLGWAPPRPLKLYAKFGNRANGWIDLFARFWVFIMPLHLIYTFFSYLKRKKTTAFHGNPDSLVFLTGNHILTYRDLIQDLSISETELRITVPWKVVDHAAHETIDLTSLLSYWEIVRTAFSTLAIFYSTYFGLAIKRNSIHWYCLFDLLLVDRVLENSYTEKRESSQLLWFSNHYDRWAVLFDLWGERYQNHQIQHGFFLEDSLPYKQTNTSTFYYFKEDHRKKFQKHILYGCENITWIEMKMQFSFSEDKTRGNDFSILVIGQPNSFEFELELLQSIDKVLSGIDLYIKPHPTYLEQWKSINTSGVIISDRSYFPKVNLALTTVSWLAVEYEAAGVNVLWFENDSVEDAIAKIEVSMNESLTN